MLGGGKGFSDLLDHHSDVFEHSAWYGSHFRNEFST